MSDHPQLQPPQDAADLPSAVVGTPQARASTQPPPYEPMLLSGPDELAHRWDFDHFEPGRANAHTLELARALALHEDRGKEYSPLLVFGEEGVGKSHLLRAIAHAAQQSLLLLHATDLEAELDCAVLKGGRTELRARLRSAPLLLIDDIHWCERTARLQEELWAVLEYRDATSRTTVLASRRPPSQLRLECEPLRRRLTAGLQAGLLPLEAEARRRVLQRYLDDQNQSFPDPVVTHLAESALPDLRRMLAASRQLLALADREEPLTVDLARAVAPLVEDLRASLRPPPGPGSGGSGMAALPPDAAHRFKRMLQGAETEEEQGLALQIAVGERLRQLKQDGTDLAAVALLETTLDLLRAGRISEALASLEL